MLNDQSFSLVDLMERHGDNEAVVSMKEQYSWKQLAERVRRFRTFWEDKANPGDIIGLFSPIHIDYIITLFTLWSKGVITAPLNSRLPLSQLELLLQNIQCSTVICDQSLSFESPISVYPFPENHTQDVHDIEKPNRLTDPVTLIFTSGSSGTFKACLHSLANHLYSALGSNENITFQPGDRWLLSLPLYHIAGIAILFRALCSGAAIAVPTADISLGQSIRDLSPTHISLVPTQLQRLLNQAEKQTRLSMMKAILLGGAETPQKLIKESFELNLPIYISYGSTEMSSQITTTQPHESLMGLTTSGKCLKYRHINIDNEGEIRVRGKTLFLGYLEGGKLDPGTDDSGWFHSGDLGEVKNGYLSIWGRKDNMFVSGGENIYPETIERHLMRLDGIEKALVVSVPHADYGARPVAFLEKRDYVEKQTIDDHLKRRLPGYMVPDHYYDWPDFDDFGKINRGQFQQLAIDFINRQS